jgi:hypothetical protein
MKKTMFTLLALLLSACASPDINNYGIYAEAQKSISRDVTIAETARIQALIEMTKSSDPAVKSTAIMLLQQLQQSSKQIVVEPPKGPLGF